MAQSSYLPRSASNAHVPTTLLLFLLSVYQVDALTAEGEGDEAIKTQQKYSVRLFQYIRVYTGSAQLSQPMLNYLIAFCNKFYLFSLVVILTFRIRVGIYRP